jgi:hypothetical protein
LCGSAAPIVAGRITRYLAGKHWTGCAANHALADLLEEQSEMGLSFCYRWMGCYRRRPGRWEGRQFRKRSVW